jgi:hypothetical protein
MASDREKLAGDWLEFAKKYAGSETEEFDLSQLRPGDRLRVVTLNTHYDLTMVRGRDAVLETGRPDRPRGPVRIMGCTFGLSTTIKPDFLFRGGNLELRLLERDPAMVHTTSEITAIYWLHVDP